MKTATSSARTNVKTSCGPDMIHPRVLKELCNNIAQPLFMIFHISAESKMIPSQWKQANVKAIYKKGAKDCAGNYRPISLTCVPC